MNSLRKAVLTLVATTGAAFAGPGSDPIIGSYEGTKIYEIVASADGIGVFQTLMEIELFAISFEPGNVVVIENFTGTWKKKGSQYLADVSESATTKLAADTADPNAKVSSKCKKIRIDPEGGVFGKLRVKRSFESNLLHIHQNDTGIFGCLPAIPK